MTRGDLALVLLVCALGGALRGVHLGEHLVWHDEVYTKIFTSGRQAADWRPVLFGGGTFGVDDVLSFQRYTPQRSVLDTLWGLARDEPQHPPLYYVLARLWVTLFGDSTATLRSLSVLFSCLSLPVGWWLARELFPQRSTALVAMLLLAVSPFFVLYAQEAREYSLWSLLILAMCAALCRALRLTEQATEWTVKPWALFAVLTATALYTSLSTVSVLVSLVLFILARERARPTRTAMSAAAAMSVGAALFSPWAILFLRNLSAFDASMRWSSVTVVPRAELLATFVLNVSRPLIDLWDTYSSPSSVIGIIAGASLALVALAGLLRAPRDAKWLLSLLFVVPVAMLLGPDLLFGGIRSVSTRYLTPSLLALVLALAWLLTDAFPRRFAQTSAQSFSRAAGCALVLMAALGSDLHNARKQAGWTKGISATLPIVADGINRSDSPLVVGNMERHHPGNLLALCHLLDPDAHLVFLAPGVPFTLPEPGAFGAIFLFSPIGPFIDELQSREPVEVRRLYEDLHTSLWQVERKP